VHFTFCYLLMIAPDTHGFISLEEKVMFLSNVRNLEQWWKSRHENPSKSFIQIKGVSIKFHQILQISWNSTTIYSTPHSTAEWSGRREKQKSSRVCMKYDERYESLKYILF
jgi:hypothetical protein